MLIAGHQCISSKCLCRSAGHKIEGHLLIHEAYEQEEDKYY